MTLIFQTSQVATVLTLVVVLTRHIVFHGLRYAILTQIAVMAMMSQMIFANALESMAVILPPLKDFSLHHYTQIDIHTKQIVITPYLSPQALI